jgi:hypothetical protein
MNKRELEVLFEKHGLTPAKHKTKQIMIDELRKIMI